jgi:peptide/nickel transport system substrate-binding protein
MLRNVKVLSALVPVGAAVLAFVTLGGANSAASVVRAHGAAGVTAVIRGNDDWDTLDPAKTNGTNMSFQMDMLLYDHLTYLSPTGKVEPQLATSWTSTPTKTVLHIRKGVTCADGTPMTPAAVAASLNYLAAPKTAAPYQARTFGVGRATATADDAAGTVTISVTKPWGATPTGLAMPWAGIVCPKGIKDPSLMRNAGEGSGPYVMTQNQRGTQYTLTARKGYSWGPGGWSTAKAQVPQTIVEKVIENDTTAANAIITGDVNLSPIIGADYARVAANKSLFHTGNEDVGATAIIFNEAKGLPGADPAVRHALDLAINNTNFMQAWTFGHGQVLNTMLTPNMPCYSTALGKYAEGYNPAKAKQILAADGWKPGAGGKLMKNGKPLTIRIAGWNVQNAAPEYLLSALTSIGVTATLSNNDTTNWETLLFTTGKYDMSAYQYQSTFPNPIIIPGQDQQLGIKDPAYYTAANHASTLPESTSCPAWDAALKMEVAGYHVKPLGANITTWFAKGLKFATAWNYVDPFTLLGT